MPKSCSAFNCTYRFQKGSGITLHKFPRDQLLREKWIAAVRRDKWMPNHNSFLCSQHFLPTDFYANGNNAILKEGVIPSVFNFKPHFRYLRKGNRKLVFNGRKRMVQQNFKGTTETEEYKQRHPKEITSVTTVSKLKPVVIYVNSFTEPNIKSSTFPVGNIESSSSFCSLPTVSEHSYAVTENPLKLQKQLQLAMKKITLINRKLQISQQKCVRLTKKVKSLERALYFLEQKNYMTTEDLKVFRTAFHSIPREQLRHL